MTVELTPKGTHGVNLPKMPRAVWKVFQSFLSLAVRLRGGQLLSLTTVGAKSGRTHTVPLGWFPDSAGGNAWLIVASYAGAARHPAWYVNMAKNPDKIWVEVDKRKIKVRGESLKGAEREAAWQRIVAAAPNYREYQTKTDREIPVVRLRPE